MTITLHPKRIILFLSIIALMLIFINSMILVIYFIVNDPDKFDFVQMFDLDMEQNIPTLFSSALLLIASFFFYLLGKSSQKEVKTNTKAWWGLSLVFAFLAFDESAKIHEGVGDFTENFVDASGFLYYPWVISYGAMTLLLGILYLRFFLRFKREIRFKFIVSAILFLSGAIGMELLGANEASKNGSDSMLYCIFFTIEESLEMFGVIYLIHTLLELLKPYNIGFTSVSREV